MTNEMQVFNYNGSEVRTVVRDGEPWFVGKDVAEALGYEDTWDALKKHVEKDDKQNLQNAGFETPRGFVCINEAGMYSLIFSSKLESAKAFKHWVTHEVLPDIRKHGMYISDKVAEQAKVDPEAFDAVVNRYLEEKEKVKTLQDKIDNDRIYTNLGKVVMALPGSVPVADAAQLLRQHGVKIGRNGVYKYGREKGFLSVQKKRWNKPTQKGIDHGIVNLELDQNGNYRLSTRTMITSAGLNTLLKALFAEEYPLAALFEEAGNETE